MKRPDWPERLAEEIKAAAGRPFTFGRHDCCAFCAGAVRAQTGRDLMAGFARYDDAAGAQQILDTRNGVRGIAQDCLGDPIPVAFAQRGDVVLLPTARGDALGIVALDGRRALFAGPRGLSVEALGACTMAWRVD